MTISATKGEQTREAVLREALAQASHVGLQGITIGGLAEALEMSKSGLYAHFRSKEQLQVDVLDFAGRVFIGRVLTPSLEQPRGEPRLRFLVELWLGWDGYADYALPGGCIFVTAAREFDDEPDGPVRDRVVSQQTGWLASLARVVAGGVTEGHFRADVDPAQVAHDINGMMLGYHFAARLLRDRAAANRTRTAFERLLRDLRP
ncbi:TetR/AcrR family transcriptional regulator [Ornithinimicrobium cavernae]|uniref:TetR/AcrR family transcriptional regulator n=1 Tax=Ornithinimicrobium cavernae TaxID=2666047 RepID=UPI001F47F9CD|nr:TetR/AcrR family transcriptional regulator [Ornithinimicrobium cavernae]